MQVTKTSEEQIQTGITDKQPDSAPNKKSAGKSIMALSVFALAINGTAAIYTLPSLDITLPNFSGLVAELLPHEKASAPIPGQGPVAAADPGPVDAYHGAGFRTGSGWRIVIDDFRSFQRDAPAQAFRILHD